MMSPLVGLAESDYGINGLGKVGLTIRLCNFGDDKRSLLDECSAHHMAGLVNRLKGILTVKGFVRVCVLTAKRVNVLPGSERVGDSSNAL